MKTAALRLIGLSVLFLQMACSNETVTTKTGTSIIIEGTYNGNNLYVKNPVGPDGLGFAINEILINGNRTSDDITSEHIEVDLKASGVREGSPIKVEIKHYKGCEPKILNPEVLK